MANPTTIKAARRELEHAVGECILSWANVELLLSLIFEATLQSTAEISHAAIGAVRSFEARLKMIGDCFNARFPEVGTQPREDWKLLYNRCSSLNRLRNQVAHAFMQNHGEEAKLEPFFVWTVKKPLLSIDDVRDRTTQFKELTGALNWFAGVNFPIDEAPSTELRTQVPDLVLRLRAEAAQRRARQQRRPQSFEQ